MTQPERRISLKIDLSSGSIELDASAEDFAQAIEKTKELAREINLGQATPLKRSPGELAAIEPKIDQQETIRPSREPTAPAKPSKPGRVAGGSSGRAGRIGSFELVQFNFSEDQERELMRFMQLKKPQEQTEQVAVAMYKGEEMLGRKALSFNEIYSLMRLSGIKDLPKALDVVIGKMLSAMWVVREGSGTFSLKFVGRDHVEQRLGDTDGNV